MVSLTTLAVLVGPALAHVSSGREGKGFIGYGITMYDPVCAYACRDTVSAWMLDCGDAGSGGHSHHSAMEMETPSPLCYATNDPFLQTLAWCISTHCKDVPISKLEQYWELNVAGRQSEQPSPKYSYQTALAMVTEPPTTVVDPEEILDVTSLVDEESYLGSYNGDWVFEIIETTSTRYSLVLFLTCTIIPIGFSLLRFLPLPKSLVSKFYAYFIDPPVFGHHHAVPVLGLAIVPTRGQALFIAYIWIINIVLSAAGFRITDPNSWYTSTTEQLTSFIGNRAGTLSFVNLALAILFSSRNNVLLYLTNWSHSTFLLVHRWIAVICTLQACLHSAIWLRLYILMGKEDYNTETKDRYWIWGIIATLSLSILLPLSALPVRRRAYELFLSSHVVLAVLSLIGCLLHIFYRYGWQWGYQIWIFVAFAVWGFDRFFARPLRIARNGMRRAHVQIVDDDYLQVNIPGVEASGQAYLYFPTLTWRVWENHPFSVAAMSGPSSGISRRSSSPSQSGTPSEDVEKHATVAVHRPSSSTELGITFYVRRRGGLTAQLASLAEAASGALVLVESSYGPEMSLIPSPTADPSFEYPNLILIAGGVGITAVLPLLDRVNTIARPFGTTKLFWGVRTEPLVHSVEEVLGQQATRRDGKAQWGNVDVVVSVGKRFDLKAVLEAELAGAQGAGTKVVVCGPAGMADDTRAAVTQLASNGAVIRLTEESFSW
ncbi:ferric reductase like transmembrane component-domain-containing protein [Massariosphaeria phaeospora]|uniref:Ferric reductase like transmembrane component-domain-containing protein n=1 Tax=Massariosphaeria phaeospora TaxID=100035 RepID=A0A7C8II59_9PLEO|nr:ferric reductase like transmembrane component-domain-containing protein [Massariosphaeria phaeospora]